MGVVTKLKSILLIFLFVDSISGLRAQSFDPANGTAYPFRLAEVTINGKDRSAAMQSNVRSCTITFNQDNTVISVDNTRYNTTYTFSSDGACEIVFKAFFIRRSVPGSGTVERSGRDFTVSLSMQMRGRDMIAVMKGRIN